MAQFGDRTTEFANNRALIAHAGQKVFDVVEQGTTKWRLKAAVALHGVRVDFVRGARTRLRAGLKIVEVGLNGLQPIVEIQTTPPYSISASLVSHKETERMTEEATSTIRSAFGPAP
jgi:hypothetical protein